MGNHGDRTSGPVDAMGTGPPASSSNINHRIFHKRIVIRIIAKSMEGNRCLFSLEFPKQKNTFL